MAAHGRAAAIVLAGALAACGGGGGGGGGVGGIVPSVGPGGATLRTGPADFPAEAGRSWGLAAVGADSAHAADRTGAGIKVGIIDTGIDLQHPDFAGAVDPASIDVITGTAAGADDWGGHGTSVAGVVGARRDGYDAVGIAPGSTLLAVRADAPGSCDPRCSFYYSDLVKATDHAVANGANILNYSLGGESISEGFRTSLAAATGAGSIVVAAAGNDGGADPINPARWAAGTEAGGLGLAVGAVDSSNAIASFSNRAGVSAERFLVAPGVAVTTSANGGGTRSASGTSFAAPHVSGAAAVVWGASPFLSGGQVVDILLRSATDLGAAGTDPVYGRGLVNLGAALSPLGTATLPTGANVADGGQPLETTRLALGDAFGDSLAEGALERAMFVDSYGRPFGTDLSASVTPARTGGAAGSLEGWLAPPAAEAATASLSATTRLTLAADEAPPEPVPERPGELRRPARLALTTGLAGTQLGFSHGFGLERMTGLAALSPAAGKSLVARAPLSSPFAALAGEGTGISVGRSVGDDYGLRLSFGRDERTGPEARPARGAVLADFTKTWPDGAAAGVQAGRLSEKAGPLASSGAGALAFGDGADTLFTGLYATLPVGAGAELFGQWGWGVTEAQQGGEGIIRATSPIHSRALSVGGALRGLGLEGDRLALALSRPLRVVSGSARLEIPDGRAMDGTVLYRSERTGLEPSGAETDFQLTYGLPLGPGQSVEFGGVLALEPGHVADAPPAWAVGARYLLTW